MSYPNRKDALLTVSKALPAAEANATTDAIDLGQADAGALGNIVAEISVPALPNLANGKTITFTLMHGAAANSLAASDPAITTTVTGPASGGSAAKAVQFRLPPGTKRFVAVKAAAVASSGDCTAAAMTFRILT